MDEYRKKLKNRIVISFILTGGLVLFVATVGVMWYRMSLDSTEALTDFMHGVPPGMCSAFSMFGVVYCVRMIRTLRDEEKLRELYIREHDERKQLIENKSFSIGFGITLYALVVATTIASFFNAVVALTLLCVVAFMIFLKLGLRVWYSRKY